MVEIKTVYRVNVRNAKNAYTDVSKNVLNDRICQGMSEIGRNKVGSVRYEITKNDIQNVKNGVSGRKEISAESLETNNEKKTFKIFNISKTSSSQPSYSKQRKVNSSQNILPAMSTPTKRKLIEAKTVQNLISRF